MKKRKLGPLEVQQLVCFFDSYFSHKYYIIIASSQLAPPGKTVVLLRSCFVLPVIPVLYRNQICVVVFFPSFLFKNNNHWCKNASRDR